LRGAALVHEAGVVLRFKTGGASSNNSLQETAPAAFTSARCARPRFGLRVLLLSSMPLAGQGDIIPTESLPSILDRDMAKASAEELIELAAPLLREVVNHATWAFQRCQRATDKEFALDAGLAPFMLYRQAIEAADAVEVLIREVCSVGMVPVVRTEFEASIGLKYLLQEDTDRRSLAWLCVYLQNRLDEYARFDPATKRGAALYESWKQEFGHAPSPPPAKVLAEKAVFEKLLAMPHMAPLAAEFASSRRRYPAWYSFFGGPDTLAALADRVGCKVQYATLYGRWSGVAHAGDLQQFLVPGGTGLTTFRSPRGIKENAFLAIGMLLRCTRLMIKTYRAGENIADWYKREVKERWDALLATRISWAEKHN
jgi:hypothetical protein